jgi:hypothetical protein
MAVGISTEESHRSPPLCTPGFPRPAATLISTKLLHWAGATLRPTSYLCDVEWDVGYCRLMAESLLGADEQRWRHVQAVAHRAVRLAADEVVVAAAWLHDIGYDSSIHRSGMRGSSPGAWCTKLILRLGVLVRP